MKFAHYFSAFVIPHSLSWVFNLAITRIRHDAQILDIYWPGQTWVGESDPVDGVWNVEIAAATRIPVRSTTH